MEEDLQFGETSLSENPTLVMFDSEAIDESLYKLKSSQVAERWYPQSQSKTDQSKDYWKHISCQKPKEEPLIDFITNIEDLAFDS